MLACHDRYGDARQFLEAFNPDAQRHCTEANLCRIYTGDAPSLGIVTRAYGEDVTDLWLSIQLRDLANFSGAREKLTADSYQRICDIIKDHYGFLKVSELLLFFGRFKAGHFGRFYGAVDPQQITCALHDFCQERRGLVDKYLYEKQRRQQAERTRLELDTAEAFRRARQVCNMPIQEYLSLRAAGIRFEDPEDLAQLGWLYRLGYESAPNKTTPAASPAGQTVPRAFPRGEESGGKGYRAAALAARENQQS